MSEDLDKHQSYFSVVPSGILSDERINDGDKVLFFLISSFTYGGRACWASDKYLADRINVSHHEVKKRLRILEDCGYITRETQKNGVLWDRKIYSNYNHEGPICTPRRSQVGTSKDTCVSQSNISKSNKRKREEEEGGKPPARSDFSAKEKEIERAQHVATTPAEHDRLTEEHGEAMMKKVYERLSVYKRQTPKAKWKKHDNLSIRNWVIDAVRDDEKKSPDTRTRQEEAQDFMKSWERPNDIKCAYYSEYLEFSKLGSAHTWSIKYTEKGFINQLEARLRKLGCRQTKELPHE